MPYTYPYPHPAVAVDACVFTIEESKLRILLIRRAGEPFKGHWALPGGFVNIDENLEQAVERELKEETGASGFHFEQLETFGEVDRDPRERVISVAYLALAAAAHVKLKAAGGVRDLDALLAVIELGCDRVGASRTAEMLDALKDRLGLERSPSPASRPDSPDGY